MRLSMAHWLLWKCQLEAIVTLLRNLTLNPKEGPNLPALQCTSIHSDPNIAKQLRIKGAAQFRFVGHVLLGTLSLSGSCDPV